MRAFSLTPGYLWFADTALQLSPVAASWLWMLCVSLTALEEERAAYMWQLQCEHVTLDTRLADLQVIFQWLLQIHAGDTTTNLVRARAGYVAELYAEKHDLDAEIAELAKLHHDMIAAELDCSSALCTQGRGLGAHDPGVTPHPAI